MDQAPNPIRIFHLQTWGRDLSGDKTLMDLHFGAITGDAAAIRALAIAGEYLEVAQLAQMSGVSEKVNLEFGWQQSNSIDAPWYDNAGLTLLPPVLLMGGCRSTSVGDIFVIGDQSFAVARSGFEPLSGLSPETPEEEAPQY